MIINEDILWKLKYLSYILLQQTTIVYLILNDLLDSILQYDYSNKVIIVIDNHSEQDPSIFIKENYPSVIFSSAEENLGFASGNNLGIILFERHLIV